MSKNRKTALIKYAVSVASSLALTYTFISLREFADAELVDKYRMLCDAFTIPGALFISAGVLTAAANAGVLDSIGYVFSFVIRYFVPNGMRQEESYYDYIQRKRERPIKEFRFLFVIGAVNMVISAIFLALFYSVFQG